MSLKHKIKTLIKFILVTVFLAVASIGVVEGPSAYPDIFNTTMALESPEELKVRESVTVNFSYPMRTETVENSLEIIPKTEVEYKWEDHNKKMIISPKKYWKPETEYSVNIENAKNMMFIKSSIDFTFETEKYPRVKSFHPSLGEKDVILDIEDPMLASFDKSIENFDVKMKISPYGKASYQSDVKEGKLEIIFTEGYEEGKKYNVEILIKHQSENDDAYQEIFETYFYTKPPKPETWSSDFETRLYEAKRFADPKIKEGKYIDINLSNQVMTAFEDGRALETHLISSGKAGMETPQGTFQIYNKHPRPWSKKYALFMPYWMAITASGSHGIHELPEWPGGYKEGENHLGTPVSHGCVRLGVGSAEKVYNWAEIGIPVVVHK